MSLLPLETAIVARVQAQVQPLGLKTEAFPERPEDYHLTHPVGAVLVVYGGSTNGAVITEAPLSYERHIQSSLCLMLRGLRAPTGVYAVLEALRAALDGWTPDGYRRGRVVKDVFIGNNDGTWIYELTFEATTQVVRPITDWN